MTNFKALLQALHAAHVKELKEARRKEKARRSSEPLGDI